MADYSIEVSVPNVGPQGPQGPATATREAFVEQGNAILAGYGVNANLSQASSDLHTGKILPFSFNTSCWLPPGAFDFSGVALNAQNGALITNKHILCARHFTPKIGNTISFLRPDNTSTSVTVSRLIPLGFRKATLKVVAVANDILYLDGIWNRAGCVAVKKTGAGQSVQMYYTNDSLSVDYGNTNNELLLYSVDTAADEVAERITGLDSSYVGATVVFYEQLDLVVAELSSTISGCAIYPLFDPEFSQRPFSSNNSLTPYAIACTAIAESSRKVLAKRLEVANFSRSKIFSDAPLYSPAETSTTSAVPTFNQAITSGNFGSGDSGSPLFLVGENNQLILFGVLSTQGAGGYTSVANVVYPMQELFAYIYNGSNYWYDAANTYKFNTLPHTVENQNKRITSGAIVDFDGSALAAAREATKALHNPNLIASDGSFVSIRSGSDAPTFSASDGSIYLRTNGTAASTLYVRAGGAWAALS